MDLWGLGVQWEDLGAIWEDLEVPWEDLEDRDLWALEDQWAQEVREGREA